MPPSRKSVRKPAKGKTRPGKGSAGKGPKPARSGKATASSKPARPGKATPSSKPARPGKGPASKSAKRPSERGGRGRGRGRGAPRPVPTTAADAVEALFEEAGVKRGFTAAIEAEARRAADSVADDPGPRRDLTGMATFTVDPATARDFDDAVSAAREGDGVRLWIHIADVAAHVRPGSALEAEAYARATSTYAPGTVEPMLPAVLSNEACSLAPDVLRPAVTAEILLSGDGEAVSSRFYRSLIRSDARLDYDQLDEIFAGRAKPPARVVEPLGLARRAAAALAARRASGALTVDSREPEFDFDAEGNVTGARMVPQTEAHSLIEQLMILTNEQVARLVEAKKVPSLYRVHEQPDPQRIEFLVEQLASLDVPTPPLPKTLAPGQAGRLAGEASRLVAREAARRGHGREAYTSLVLRSLKQAAYSDRNVGHAGLGSSAYSHFTSPIRRYPDLIAHRALLSIVGEGEQAPRAEHVHDAGWHSSLREREAMKLERKADDVCAAFLLERELAQRGREVAFEGEVSGVIGAGLFVGFAGELGAVYEGFLPARRMPGDRFDLNETQTALVGRHGGAAVRLGDPIAVKVDAVEAPRGRVDLSPVEETAEKASKPKAAPRPGSRQGGGRR